MASYHLSVKNVQRSAGRSATAAAAYRHAERIECQREGRVHDYTRKAGVEHSFIVAPEGAPEWAQDRAALWNAAEARETRSNSVVAREWELALPSELDGIGRRVLARTFARELVDRYGVAADVAIHAPHREGDQRNWHAHVLTTTRRMEAQGLTDKTRVLDAKQTGSVEVEQMRERWAALQNQALERHGHEARVDHRRLEVQRERALSQGREQQAEELDRAAEVKLGPVVSAIERREQRAAEKEERVYEPLTERGAQVHEARQARGLFAELAGELGQARERLAQELRERAELARQAYAREMEEGTSRISAGLAALRAAAQRSGVVQERTGYRRDGHEHEHEGADPIRTGLAALRAVQQRPRGPEPGLDSIREQLAKIRGQEKASGQHEREHGPTSGLDSIREQLARIRGQEAERDVSWDQAEAAQVPTVGQGLAAVREQLQRLRERENTRSHESIRETLNQALGRARHIQREEPEHERSKQERQAHERSRRAHQREDDGHDWGL